MGMALEGGEVHAGNVVYYLPVGLNSLGAWLGHLQFEPPKKNMRKAAQPSSVIWAKLRSSVLRFASMPIGGDIAPEPPAAAPRRTNERGETWPF
jgi:hypothetical protein